MMITKKINKRLIAFVLICIAVLSVTAVIVIASPGDGNDPLITLSYINDTVIPNLKSYVDEKVASSSSSSNQTQTVVSGSAGFSLVNIKANHTVIGDEGTEFVLRMGNGTIVATSNGGVADLTDGTDLADGTPIPANHNLLSPKNDKRGLHMDTAGIVLIKGTYTVIPD